MNVAAEQSKLDPRIVVALLTSSLERGGAERQVVELANALDPSIFRVVVISLSDENPLAHELHDANNRLIVLRKRRKFDLALVLRVARTLRRINASVVHSFMFDAEMVGRLAGRLARVPAVICSNRCPHLGRSKFKLWLSRATESCFDVIIANSWAGLEFERDTQGMDPARLCVVPNGVDTSRFAPRERAGSRRELGIPEDAVVFGMFAHFRGNKDPVTLLKAAVVILERNPSAYLVLVGASDGDGPLSLFGQCRAIAAEAPQVADRILFTGRRDDAARLYNMIDIKVLSTRFEGTPNVILEAMASGLPVVTTDVSDNRRIVLDGQSGFLVPPSDVDALANRMELLIRDEPLRRAMGVEGRSRAVSEFSTQALARRTAAVYFSVLRQKRGTQMPVLGTPAGSDA
ncbi:MAG TPA: glycosyltransferase [Phycisphaerae bacterium]|nr:glycosyltransferase [Phycisphaerae bacterium]